MAPAVLRTREVRVQWSKRDETLANWEQLRSNPDEWYDNRTRKTNPKAPDFVRKDDRAVALWIDGRDVPTWVEELCNDLDSRQSTRRQSRDSEGGDSRGERRSGPRDGRQAAEASNWEALRSNPEEWYDNRNRKTSDRQPDFVRRDDRNSALWLDSRGAPEWVGELLSELDARQAARREQRAAERAAGGGDERSQEGGGRRGAEELVNWEALRANPAEWYDNRSRKTSDRQPDFVRRDDRRAALWLDSRGAPPWVGDLLAELDAAAQARRQQRQAERGAAPSTPELEAKRAAEAANWESLRANPEAWFDNRNNKQTPKSPDFRKKDDRTQALWVTSYGAPEWLNELLTELDARQTARY
ncbi:hypothetical protein HXX76_012054 [Chlamydomonas incerta]|uniref:Uncharacterized protein n=1 Tax=Chlamydomonas incerta TaxID=51695 RepID=A0A835ST05_CHLIN|nr:hypothetical protein HXX76_012054 [Chlamydomonas incerta]|eukprot:KAG2427729.1 hypothetical protein HXX76_012054 [Chlamydomonas incerta]